MNTLFDENGYRMPYKNKALGGLENNLFLDVAVCEVKYAAASRRRGTRTIWQPIIELEMKGQTFFIIDRSVVKSFLIGLIRGGMGHRAFMAIYKTMPLQQTLEYWMTLEDSAKTLTGRFRELTTGDKVITSINTKDIPDSRDFNRCIDLLETLGYTSKIYNYDDGSVKLIATSEYADEIEMEVLNDNNTYINGKYNVMQMQHEKDREVWSTNYFIQPTLAKNLNFEDTFKVERVNRDLHAGIEETRKWCPLVRRDGWTDRNYPVLNGCVKHSIHVYNLARHDRNRLMHEMFLDVRRAYKKN